MPKPLRLNVAAGLLALSGVVAFFGGGFGVGVQPTIAHAQEAVGDAPSGEPLQVAPCTNGTVRCGSRCVYLSSDSNHCGACGAACARAHECVQGACKLACPSTQLSCKTKCVTPTSDSMHCGACDSPCGADQFCVSGQCKSYVPAGTCPATQKKCGETCRDTMVDSENCGACGKVCASGHKCSKGSCVSVCAKEKIAPK